MNKTGLPVPQPILSQRQCQILKLLQAGKVNKEVAQELDIGLGTVKQHIVALFKKLNVCNRAMAVSRGMSIQHEQERHGKTIHMDGLLERRPCVVLSIAVPENANPLAVRVMHGRLAEIAATSDALFLARKGNAGDIIFGLQQITVYDFAIALQSARSVHDDLQKHDVHAAENMRASLIAGLAIVSMRRFGGWTEEAIASTAIATARELLNNSPPGFGSLDPSVMDLARVLGIGWQKLVVPVMPLQEIINLQWTGSPQTYPLIGRNEELGTLNAALKKASLQRAANRQGRLIYVKGEMGMGKSRLCAEILMHCSKKGGVGRLFRCLPPRLNDKLYDTDNGVYCSAEEVTLFLQTAPALIPEMVVIDDLHLLDATQQRLLTAAATAAASLGKLVVLTGRRALLANGSPPSETINLPRLSDKAIEKIVRQVLGNGRSRRLAHKINDISRAAAGVALFAVELARPPEGEPLPLPLRIVINARLDSLHLDRILLRAIAKCADPASLQDLAATLDESVDSVRMQVEKTAAAGVLKWAADDEISFTHPLLRRAIISLIME
jgi:DNA-binding CsgD family transcriptional regulator